MKSDTKNFDIFCNGFITYLNQNISINVVCDYRDDMNKSLGLIATTSLVSKYNVSFTDFITSEQLRGKNSLGSFKRKGEIWLQDLLFETSDKSMLELFERIQFKCSMSIPKRVVDCKKPVLYICGLYSNYAEAVITFPEAWYNMYIPCFYGKNAIFSTQTGLLPMRSVLANKMIILGGVIFDIYNLLQTFDETGLVLSLYIDCSNLNNAITREKLDIYTKKHNLNNFKCVFYEYLPTSLQVATIRGIVNKYNAVVTNQLKPLAT